MRFAATSLATAVNLAPMSALADVVAVVSICANDQRVCKEDTARSVYRIPAQGQIFSVSIQQRLAEMGVHDEEQDTLAFAASRRQPAESACIGTQVERALRLER